MKHLSYIFLATAIAYLTFVSSAVAGSGNCQPIYGGGQTCVQTGNVTVEKKIVHPKTGALVDNIQLNDDKFSPDMPITFQIAVVNTGSTKIDRVQVKDIFPKQYVDFSTGAGNYDSNTKTLTFEITDLNPGERRTQNIVGKTVSANQLPIDKGVICGIINQATAKDMADTSNNFSHDIAELCIQKEAPAAPTQAQQPGVTVVPGETKGGMKVFPPQKVITAPSTGPEMLPLLALLPTGAFGFFLRRKTQ